MRNTLVKKLLSLIVIACLLFSSFGVAFGATAAGTSDLQGHWAASKISAWIDKGFIKGYDDGSFKPDNQITRAEFIALINRSFGFTETSDIAFRDVASDNWAHAEVAKAVKAGYISGYADGTIGINKPISRQEAAVIVSRLLTLNTATDAANAAFIDASQMAAWSKDAIGEVVAAQIMNGYDADHSFKPLAPITRAEAVVTLDRAQAAQTTVVYQAAGTYGPETGVETIKKNVTVNAAGVTLRNMVINGDLLLAEGIGNGDAFLENVKVTGKVTVQGGGENSIHFNNSVLVDIIIDKKSGTGTVRIVSEGTTTVALVTVKSPAILKETNLTGNGFGNVNMSSLPAGSKVTLAGSFNTVNVSSQQLQIDMPEGSIQKMNVTSTSTGMVLNLSDGAKINDLVLDAIIKMLGKGTIVLATMNVGGSTFETPPTKTTTTTTPTPAPTSAPSSSSSSPSTPEPEPTQTPEPTSTPAPTSTPEPTSTPAPSQTPAPTPTPSSPPVDTANEDITAAKALLTADTIRNTNTALTAVIADLTLSTAGSNGTTIAWRSEDTAIDTNSGAVTRPAYTEGNRVVHLTATITKDAGTPQTKEFEVTVLKDTSDTDGRLLALHLNNVTLSPAFSPDIQHYEATVPFIVTNTKITAIPMNPNADIRLNYEDDTKLLLVGSNEVQIYVNHADEDGYDIYTVQIHRLAIDVVAQAAAIATIKAYHGEDIDLIHVLNTATGRNTAIPVNVNFYRDAILAAEPGDLDTAEDILWMIDDVNEANEVPPANKTNLISAISQAAALLSNHSVGLETGNVSQEVHNAYEAAIAAASAVQASAIATQNDVDAAVMALSSATAAFRAAILVPIPTFTVDGSLSNHMPMITVANVAAGDQITVYDTDGTSVIGSGKAAGTSITMAIDPLTVGTHTLKVKSVDSSGQSSVYSAGVSYVVQAISILPANRISESQAHIATLAANGQVYTWGYNYGGQIGDGTQTPRTQKFAVPNLPLNIIAVQAGEGYTAVLTADGHIWKWGYYDLTGPKKIAGIDHVVSISAEGTNVFALKSDGTVWKFAIYATPTQVQGLDHVIAVRGEWSDVGIALKADGTVWAWGANDNGQLGDGTGVNKPAPVKIEGLPFIVDIRNGDQHSLALSVTGAVYAWGFNAMGQIGNGTTNNQLAPYEVEGLSNITQIGAGNYYSFAIDNQGKMFSWGANWNGSLGIGSFDNRNTPTLIATNLTNVLAITGGEGSTSIALQSNGDIWTWGNASDGLLGSGETSNRPTPGKVANFNLFNDPATLNPD
ncbi:RCC1 domain-containing protein [Paenibacillus planticolens]|uniref:SLH domain-containing protein n=1 Tax=Paenibacillus planticolens TaxID=2654976 RepID=A0ABX2A1C9_9BACL|nr:S-layer homology domain-containing protein [Paenibacillus planticolens]NOV04803.1 hypothetical protein [Paenibacillus planticolens]